MASTTTPIANVSSAPAGNTLAPPHAPGGAHRTAKTEKRSAASFVEDVPWQELGVPLAVLCVILAMIAPVPAFLLDFLIAINMTFSVRAPHRFYEGLTGRILCQMAVAGADNA